MQRTPIPAIPDAPPIIRNLAHGRSIHDTSICLCSIRDCGFSHVKVSGLVMGACRPLLQGLV